jgi:MFS family permease
LWQLIVLQFVRGSATAFFNAALTGLTPLLVTGEHLQQANVLRGIAQGAGGIAGPAIAGVLVATVASRGRSASTR